MPSPELSPELLSVLVCPKDHGKLTYEKTLATLTCHKCAHVYPVENGVPNMLK